MKDNGQEIRMLVAGIGDIPAWDSLAQVAIMTALEERYGLEPDDGKLMDATTIADLISLVNVPPPFNIRADYLLVS